MQEDRGIKDLEKELSKLEERLFLINMIDVWSTSDKILYDQIFAEIKKIKKEIENIKNK